ncbi:hypothetical protein P4479_18035 [Brevibacillus agri]|uniref:hypothetical protein n=1 Tax=Brevibacillus agri TaxID=51101 RepID=UPI002E1E69DD|nr:hypothetical protein [Brevibacillus agri]
MAAAATPSAIREKTMRAGRAGRHPCGRTSSFSKQQLRDEPTMSSPAAAPFSSTPG